MKKIFLYTLASAFLYSASTWAMDVPTQLNDDNVVTVTSQRSASPASDEYTPTKNIYGIDTSEDNWEEVSPDHSNITRIYTPTSQTTTDTIAKELLAASIILQANAETMRHVSVIAEGTYRELNALLTSLNRASHLTSLVIHVKDQDNNDIGEHVGPIQPIWKAFIEALTNLHKLRHLEITWKTKDLPTDSAYKLGEALRGKQLVSFTSRGLPDINSFLIELAPVLSNMPTLRILDFMWAMDINDGGAATLAGILAHLSNLEELYLADNRIGDKGLACIAKGLQGSLSLRAVSIAQTNITPAATQDVLKIALHPNMRALNARGTDYRSARRGRVDPEFVSALESYGYVNFRSHLDVFFFSPSTENVDDWIKRLSQGRLMKD